jgi:hypothetical protein
MQEKERRPHLVASDGKNHCSVCGKEFTADSSNKRFNQHSRDAHKPAQAKKEKLLEELVDVFAKHSEVPGNCQICSSPLSLVPTDFQLVGGGTRTVNLAVCLKCSSAEQDRR